MLNRVAGKKLGRNTNTRKALFRALVRSMVEEGSIKTTKAKASAVVPLIDKIMSKAKSGSLADRRYVLSALGNDEKTTEKIFTQFTALLDSRESGFTKMTKLPARRGDNARLVRLEWTVQPEAKLSAGSKKEKSKAVKKETKKEDK